MLEQINGQDKIKTPYPGNKPYLYILLCYSSVEFDSIPFKKVGLT